VWHPSWYGAFYRNFSAVTGEGNKALSSLATRHSGPAVARASLPRPLRFCLPATLLSATMPIHMTEPLALVVYEKLLPGSQLVNRLQDLKYRVQTLSDPSQLTSTATDAKPMLVFLDLDETGGKNPAAAVKALKQNSATAHIPIVGFMTETNKEFEERARTAGVTVVATEAVLLNHLPQLLEQALHIE
jgi:CheY-like chemotaxis protein